METETKINDLYDKMIENASNPDAVSNIESIRDQINQLEEQPSTELQIPEVTDKVTGETAIVSYNPTTGEQVVVDSNAQAPYSNSKDTFLANGESDIPSVDQIIKTSDLNDAQDAVKIAELIQRRLKGESFDYYAELPESLKNEISKAMMGANVMANRKAMPSKNAMAKMCIDNLVAEYKKDSKDDDSFDLDSMLFGFGEDIEKATNEISTDLGNMMMQFDEERRSNIDTAIERCKEAGNEETIAKLEKIKDTLDKAYTLDDFAEFCLHCKIKNYDMEKPERWFDDFNYKYLRHKNTINDIHSCPIILDRHLPDIDHKYKVMLCIAFCKYCRNMSPDNIDEHTFMYYFIRNIIAIDRVNPKGLGYNTMDEKSKKFYDDFTANLTKCINNLITRNITLK